MQAQTARALVSSLVMIAAFGVAEGQTPPDRIELTLTKGPAGDVVLDWHDACSKPGTDYAVYEGDLAVADSHTWLECSTFGSPTATVSPAPGNTYYLVVPLEDGAEGSYGVASGGVERNVGTSTCLAQSLIAHCQEDNFVDASVERLARLDEVLDAVAAIIESGGTYTDVADMLALELDVTDVYSNGISLFFKVDDLSTSVYDGVAGRHNGPLREIIPHPNPITPPPGGGNLATDPIPAGSVPPILPRGQRMVGKDDDADGFRDMPKHALILSPWAFDFPNDSAPVVEGILNGIRDYQEGSVTFKSNTTDLLTDTMTLSDYTDGWEEKDIIFLSSHGGQDDNACWGPDPFIFMGIGGATCADMAAKIRAEVPDKSQRPGLYCSFVTEIGPGPNPVIGRDVLGTRAFWENAHGGALDKKLIWFDACKSAKHPGLAEALTGTDSMYFGWSESVWDTTSVAAAEAVLRESAEDGFTVLRSFVRECSGGACADPPDPDNPSAELLAAWHRADLRTRDSLTIASTPAYGFCGVSPTNPVELTCPSCGGGMAMSMSFPMLMEGFEPDEVTQIQDPLEFGMYQLRLFADVDDVESGYALVLVDSFLTDVGNGAYTDLFGMTLYMDNICPNQVIEYNPWILLPTFDVNMSGNSQRDRIYSWDGPFTITIDPVILP